MNDYEELIYDLENTWIKDAENGEFTHPSVLRRCKYLVEQLVKERDAAVAIVKELADMDYCHNFQREAWWIVDYIYAVTEIQRKCKEWRGAEDANNRNTM